MIELVIKLKEVEYGHIVKSDKTIFADTASKEAMMYAIKNGTSLPKGHGELIDRNKIEYLKAIHDAKYGHISWSDAIKKIKHSAPTIIEADKEGDEV